MARQGVHAQRGKYWSRGSVITVKRTQNKEVGLANKELTSGRDEEKQLKDIHRIHVHVAPR